MGSTTSTTTVTEQLSDYRAALYASFAHVPGRNADDVAYWLFGAMPSWRDGVAMVAIDPHRGYANGLLRGLPGAGVTVDHFHAVKVTNENGGRRAARVQQETLGHRGHRDDPLYGSRQLMTRAYERLNERQRARLRSSTSRR